MASRFRSGDPRLAVLSYHSWDTPPEMVAADVRALRSRGWRFVTASEATAFLHGRHLGGSARLALVTTDDAHATDVGFREALQAEECPAVTFVPVGRVASERIEWLRRTHGDDWSVQDHGPMHQRQFVSGHVTGIYHGQKIGGLEHLGLQVGAPLLVSSGELGAPRFEPHPEAVALCTELARAESPETLATEQWVADVCERLRDASLAYRWRGRTHILGTVETGEAFEQRVARDIREGLERFERAIGHAPTMFAYPWWQGNAVADRLFAASGYRVTFAGVDRLQGAHHSPFSVPRVVMDPRAARPVNLDALHDRARHDWTGVRRRVEGAAKRLMGIL